MAGYRASPFVLTAKDVLEQTGIALLESHPLTNVFGDFYGYGKDGGALHGEYAYEIISGGKNGNRVIATRVYNKFGYEGKKEAPLTSAGQIVVNPQTKEIEGFTIGGKAGSIGFDPDFERWGSAGRMTRGDSGRYVDRGAVRKEMMGTSIATLVKRKKPIGRGLYVSEVVVAPPSFLERFDPRGLDGGLILSNFVFELITRGVDPIYDVLINKPLEKVEEIRKRTGAGPLVRDPWLILKHKVVAGLHRYVTGIASPEELFEGAD